MNSQPATARRTASAGRLWQMWQMWAGPLVMAVLTASGLITALLSDTWGDWWSWVGLGVPTAAMVWYAWLRPAPRPGRGEELAG